VLAHGLTANALASRYGRAVRGAAANSPPTDEFPSRARLLRWR